VIGEARDEAGGRGPGSQGGRFETPPGAGNAAHGSRCDGSGRGPAAFEGLTPAEALSAVEEAFGVSPDGSFFSYPSYINRVYGFKADDGREFVAKFYRPGRWRPEAIAEEQALVLALAAAEIPVVAPLPDLEGDYLPALDLGLGGPLIFFCLFPKRGGRSFEADGCDDLRRLGALAGRMHAASRAFLPSVAASRRPRMAPGLLKAYAEELRRSGCVDRRAEDAFFGVLAEAEAAVDEALAGYAPGGAAGGEPGPRALPASSAMGNPFAPSPLLLHGDFHRGNVLDRGPEGLLAIDFDDACVGPAVQDLWMLLPGRVADSPRELEAALEGYEEFTSFDYSQLGLVEPLRLLRMVHYLAWQARQAADPGFLRHFPRWGERAFWEQETEDLRLQIEHITSGDDHGS
jgi:Ser/Thr protein kinase RdoA (MazF antagonist)